MRNLASLISAATAAALVIDAACQRRRKRSQPQDAIIVCQACLKCRATARCRAHNQPVCGRCCCPTCKEIRERVKAGKPRLPRVTGIVFDGPNAYKLNDPNWTGINP